VNPLTRGYICGKVRSAYTSHVHGRERLMWPAVRHGPKGAGEFRRVRWDEALDRVAAELLRARDEVGGEAILPFSYGGSNGLLTQDTTDARLFWRLGSSCLDRTVCAAPSTSAAIGMYGKMPGVAFCDYVEAELIIVWGANPAVTGIHLMPFLQEAKRRGAFIAVVDPYRTQVARSADLHLQIRPGTDVPVALSIVRGLFDTGAADEEFLAQHTTGAAELRRRAQEWSYAEAATVSGVDADAIAALCERYARASPAVIRCGWGLERNRNGGSAIASVLALPAVAGKFGIRGGGYTMSNSEAWATDSTLAANAEEPATRRVNMNLLGETLISSPSPPVSVLFVYNCNPAMTMPQQAKVIAGLRREDLFTVVFDQVMTDTARYADVVLPATTFLEHTELRASYGAYALQRSNPVIPAVGEARPNYEVFADLCRRTGVAQSGDPESADELIRAIVAAEGEYGALVLADLARAGVALPRFGDQPVQFGNVWPRTPGRKAHLVPAELDEEAGGLYSYRQEAGAAEFPLILISPASKRTVSSTLGEARTGQVAVEIHPEDADGRGIETGDKVRIHNERGELTCLARVGTGIRPGVAFLPKGLWSHNTLSGTTGNALVPDTLTDLGGGACFNDTRVQIERLD
jgi:anaerobic selenocysteine-containing dehydrogenase